MTPVSLVYLQKYSPEYDLPNAIRTVFKRGRAIDPELAAQAWSESDPLTNRERQVLRLSAAGLSNAQIAMDPSLYDGTVRNYIPEALARLAQTIELTQSESVEIRVGFRTPKQMVPRHLR